MEVQDQRSDPIIYGATPQLRRSLAYWGSTVAHRAGCAATLTLKRSAAARKGKKSKRLVITEDDVIRVSPSIYQLAESHKKWIKGYDGCFPAGIIPITVRNLSDEDKRLAQPRLRLQPSKIVSPNAAIVAGFLSIDILFKEMSTTRRLQSLICWLEAVPRYAEWDCTLDAWAYWRDGEHVNLDRLKDDLDNWVRGANQRIHRIRSEYSAKTARVRMPTMKPGYLAGRLDPSVFEWMDIRAADSWGKEERFDPSILSQDAADVA